MPQPKSRSASARSGSSRGSARPKSSGQPFGAKRKTTARSAGSTRKTTARGTGSTRKTTARGTGSTRKTTARGSGTARKSTARASGAGRKTAARSSTASRARGRGTGGRAGGSARPGGDETLAAVVVSLREHLIRGVVLTAERLQEALDDAVRRGRITRDDAEELLQSLIAIGRKQTEDVLADLEQIVGRREGSVTQAARDAGKRAAARFGNTATRARRSQGADRVLREVDRARRAARLGPAFPVTAYTTLTATQVASRLDDLTAAQLRKVRDYELRNERRRSVLDAIERRLSR
jgi:hypothetical protein